MNKIYSLLVLSFCFISMSAQTPKVNFIASDTTLCAYDCITFYNLSQGATSYQWYFPGGSPSSSTAPDSVIVCYLDAGSYDVTLIAMDSLNSDTLTSKEYITVNPYPPVPVIYQSNDTLYFATDTSYVSYQWYDESTAIPGATNNYYVLTVPCMFNYNVQVTNKFGCSIAVGINSTLCPNFSASKTIICKGDCISFYDSTKGYYTDNEWSFPGATPSSCHDVLAPYICYYSAGQFDVTLAAWNDSSGGGSLTRTDYITVLPPPTPLIREIHDTLFCAYDSTYSAYQWSHDGIIITGATNPFLPLSQSGLYSISVTNLGGCTGFADTTILGVQNYMSDHVITIYPNPATEKLRIKNEELRIREINIYNIFGQICCQSEIKNPKSEIMFDVSMLPSGIYFVQLIGGKNDGWGNL